MNRLQLARPCFLMTLGLIVATLAFGPFAMSSRAQTADNPTVLITGSNRGIGFEFTRQYAARGWNVIATCRNPEAADSLKELSRDFPNITIEKLDVQDHDMIEALAEKYKETPIDVLLNNAGILGGMENQFFGNINYDVWQKVMLTNAIGPLKMAETFMENVVASEHKKIMVVSSTAGSFTHPEIEAGARYFYRASKSAVNMFMRTLSRDIRKRGVIVGMLSPGIVLNDTMREAMKTRELNLDFVPVEESVGGMIKVIDELTLERSGSYIRYTGTDEPW